MRKKLGHQEKQQEGLNRHGIPILDRKKTKKRVQSSAEVFLQIDESGHDFRKSLSDYARVFSSLSQKTPQIAESVKGIFVQIKNAISGLLAKI